MIHGGSGGWWGGNDHLLMISFLSAPAPATSLEIFENITIVLVWMTLLKFPFVIKRGINSIQVVEFLTELSKMINISTSFKTNIYKVKLMNQNSN